MALMELSSSSQSQHMDWTVEQQLGDAPLRTVADTKNLYYFFYAEIYIYIYLFVYFTDVKIQVVFKRKFKLGRYFLFK